MNLQYIDEEDNFIIFELKLSRGNDATLGQILSKKLYNRFQLQVINY
ncbi:hypothetical protein ONV75_12685 [Clostridium sp. LQ25]|jgi:hypothetical protein|uniref:Uncharacterized protein n=1 Tax=Clostridium butyricum TaxID=1492 RepID=A0A512TQU0_CLOBU|nr:MULTISPECIES: hypothetical protein [Clostridium]ETI88946.1 MAG: hypothetical protein Q607_CBUC00185G0008 [Clostridium butyricum DORA_1]MDU3594757.1 hypothetical protein [Clostridium butyricum]MDU6038676.1 hypothetical protein [Clostridium butyricum]NAS17444.1 hypothetical protein [Clostridium butyricum]NOW22614.1 hypothetical protein [Clostridium butyricum]